MGGSGNKLVLLFMGFLNGLYHFPGKMPAQISDEDEYKNGNGRVPPSLPGTLGIRALLIL